MNIDTSSEYTSSSEIEFLSTDPSEPGLSESEVKKMNRSGTIRPDPRPRGTTRYCP